MEKMKLERKEQVKVIEVLADYKEKVKVSPFIAILKFAYENDNKINIEELCDFIGSLSEKACENILERLKNNGYFKIDDEGYDNEGYDDEDYYDEDYDDEDYDDEDYDDKEYILTDLGVESAKAEEFFEDKKGVLRLHIVTNEFVKQQIVKIEKVDRLERKERESFIDISKTVLSSLSLSKKIELTDGEFIIENIESKCEVKEGYDTDYVFDVNEEFLELNVEKFNVTFKGTKQDIINYLLKGDFGDNYLEEDKILELPLDTRNLSLIRNIKIEKPYINSTKFNKVEIKSIKISPKRDELFEWYKALLISQIDNHGYFLVEEDYINFFKTTISDFHLYQELLEGSVTKEALITALEDHFYKQTKLTAINYLNY